MVLIRLDESMVLYLEFHARAARGPRDDALRYSPVGYVPMAFALSTRSAWLL